MDVPLWVALPLQIILIFINAFFACAEIAVISLNENKLKKAAEEGDKKASKMLKMVANSTAFLSTIQVCITLAGFLASAFAAENFAESLAKYINDTPTFASLPDSFVETLCLILVTILLSFVTLVFGELVPKRIAMAKSEKVAKSVCGSILFAGAVMKPVIWLLTVCTNGILRLLGINPVDEGEEVTEEEIRMMVDISEENGNINANEKDMIENVFEFNNISASEIMVHRTNVQTIHIDDTDEDIFKIIESTGLSRFPVYGEDLDDILGILNARRFLMNRHQEINTPIRDLLKPAYFVPEMVHADVLFRDMQSKKISFAVLVDEYGGMSGIVTMEDLLEEIVGNIYDEFDPQPEFEIEKIDDETWRVSGSMPLDKMSEEIEWDAPEDEDFETLGGLVYSVLSEIPSDNDTPRVEAYGLDIQVEKIEERHIKRAVVKKLPKDSSENEEDKD